MAISSILLVIVAISTISTIKGSRICYKCTGIQCYRTTQNQTETCDDNLDICVTVFDNFDVVARGCSQDISPDLMKKCSKYDEDNNSDCHKCNQNLCNDLGREEFSCIQCDSKEHPDCKINPHNIVPKRCPITTAPTSYCFSEYKNDETVIRGCSGNVQHQRYCLENSNCMLCLAGDLENCNTVELSGDDNNNSTTTTTTSPSNTTTTTTSPSNTTTTSPSNTTTTTTSPSNTTTTSPSNTTTTTTSPSNTTTTTSPSNTTTASPITTKKPGKGGAMVINLTIGILIVSLLLNFIC